MELLSRFLHLYLVYCGVVVAGGTVLALAVWAFSALSRRRVHRQRWL